MLIAWIVTGVAALLLLLALVILPLIEKIRYGNRFWDFDVSGCDICWVLFSVLAVVSIVMFGTHWSTEAHAEYTRVDWEEERYYLVQTYNEYENYFDNDIVSFNTIAEVRREIAEFNSEIRKNKMKDKNIWYGGWYIDPDYVKPIEFIDGKAQ